MKNKSSFSKSAGKVLLIAYTLMSAVSAQAMMGRIAAFKTNIASALFVAMPTALAAASLADTINRAHEYTEVIRVGGASPEGSLPLQKVQLKTGTLIELSIVHDPAGYVTKKKTLSPLLLSHTFDSFSPHSQLEQLPVLASHKTFLDREPFELTSQRLNAELDVYNEAFPFAKERDMHHAEYVWARACLTSVTGDKVPVGLVIYTVLKEGELYIERLAVSPRHQKMGIGAALIRYLEQTPNCTHFRLYSMADGFYLKLGFHREMGSWMHKTFQKTSTARDGKS